MSVWLLLELDVLGVLVEEGVGSDVVDVVLVARVLGNMFLLVAMLLLLLVVTTYVEFLWRKSCEFESLFSTFVPSVLRFQIHHLWIAPCLTTHFAKRPFQHILPLQISLAHH